MDEIFVRVVQTAVTPGPVYEVRVEQTIGGATTVVASTSLSTDVFGLVDVAKGAIRFIQLGFLQPSPPIPISGVVRWEFLTLTPV